jgi:hypothetical protein
MVSTGILLGAVLAILAAGGLLRADKAATASPVRERELASQAPPPVFVPAPPEPASAPQPLPGSPPPAGGDLDRRAERDLLRLSRSRGSFTAQVLVTCKPDNTKRILQKTGGSDRLFLLPLPDRGPTCYRVCWGIYGTPKAAAAASDLPAFLLQGGGRPSAKAVQDLAP